MASLLCSSRMPQCTSCLRRATVTFTDAYYAPTRMQVRGKKKLATPSTVKVRLLKDIPRYGRQGSIIPVAPGRMRNEFYPKKKAEYVTKAQLKELGMENTDLERDSSFGIAQPQAARAVEPEKEEEKVAIRPAKQISTDLLEPEHAMKVIAELLPDNIDFFRSPITISAPLPKRVSPSIPTTSAISAAAREAAEGSNVVSSPAKTSIYGSVSTADIATNLKAVLAEDDEGSRVVLGAEDISFVEETEEKDRVKYLGIFEIEIKIKGASDVIRRTIKINAQD